MTALADEAWVQRELVHQGPLLRGSQGSEVQRVQEWLSFHGETTDPDGFLGPATEKAVGKFQVVKGLPRTGVVDDATYSLLTAPLHAVLSPLRWRPQSMSEAILACAHRHLQVGPKEIGGDNRGPWVRLYMKGVDGTQSLWCAGFACTIIRQAAEFLGQNPSVIYDVSCDGLAWQAQREMRFLSAEEIAADPDRADDIQPGSLFLVRYDRRSKDWTHTGIVIESDAESCSTIEGNASSKSGGRDFEVCKRERAHTFCDYFLLP